MPPLFEEFPPVSTEQWLEVVQRDLKGADFEKRLVSTTLDGVRLKPFYRSEDLPAEREGAARGARRSGNPWAMREEVREDDLGTANEHARRALNRGADELAVHVYPIGPGIRTQADMARFLEGIWIEAVPVHWLSGPLAAHTLALLVNTARDRGLDPAVLRGSVDLDPLMDRCSAWTDAPWETWKEELFAAAGFLLAEMPAYTVVTVRGAILEKAGASLAQELALTVGLLAEYVAAFREGLASGALQVPGAASPEAALEQVVGRMELRFGIGTHYFLEIAKLRAARVLVANVLKAFGVERARPRVHAVTTSSNKTLYDPYNNLLRGTVEAMAAVVAGVDSLSVAAYNQGYHTPDEFTEHLARNTETLLKEEAYLSRVADPLGGSYTVESLTHSYAEAAWTLFRRLEAEGGFAAAWQSGTVGAELDRVRAARGKQVSTRRRTIVGTTVYPNLKERRLPDVQPREPSKQVRAAGTAVVPALAESLRGGASLAEWVMDRNTPSTPLDPFRPSWPYEHLRLRVERHVAAGGKQPVIFLALMGDPTMRRARAGFCLGLFGAAGYDVQEAILSDADAAGSAAREAGADALVLCSSDAEYPELVRAVRTDLPLIVAGYPQDVLEELKAAGVRDFVHIQQDLLETLQRYHAEFGIPEVPV